MKSAKHFFEFIDFYFHFFYNFTGNIDSKPIKQH